MHTYILIFTDESKERDKHSKSKAGEFLLVEVKWKARAMKEAEKV